VVEELLSVGWRHRQELCARRVTDHIAEWSDLGRHPDSARTPSDAAAHAEKLAPVRILCQRGECRQVLARRLLRANASPSISTTMSTLRRATVSGTRKRTGAKLRIACTPAATIRSTTA